MIAQLIRLEMAPEVREAGLALQSANLAGSRAEPGCLRFDLAAATDQAGVYYLWEAFRDQAALDAHYATPHFRAWKEWMMAQSEGTVVRTRFPMELVDP